MSKMCRVCNTACSDETKYCPNCGTKLSVLGVGEPLSTYDDHDYPHSTVGPEIPEEKPSSQRDNHADATTTQLHNAAYQTPTVQTLNSTPKEHGMLWYKILIYVVLFISAFSFLLSGMAALNQELYDGAASKLYLYAPILQVVDSFYGLAMLLLAGWAIYTRFRLAGFRRNGPRCLYILIAANLIVTLAYSVAAVSVLSTLGKTLVDTYSGISLDSFAAISKHSDLFNLARSVGTYSKTVSSKVDLTWISNVIYLTLNAIYFSKRANKFVNM